MCSEMSDLVPVPQDLSGTHLPDPADLNIQRRTPSGLPGASVPVLGLVSVAIMQPNPLDGTVGVHRALRHEPFDERSAWMS